MHGKTHWNLTLQAVIVGNICVFVHHAYVKLAATTAHYTELQFVYGRRALGSVFSLVPQN